MDDATLTFSVQFPQISYGNLLVAKTQRAGFAVETEVENIELGVGGSSPFIDHALEFVARGNDAVNKGNVPLAAQKFENGNETFPTNETIFPVSLKAEDSVSGHVSNLTENEVKHENYS